MQPVINEEQCIGCGACAGTCPEVFRLKPEGKAEVINGVNYDDYKEKIQTAVSSCPTQAISTKE